MIINTRVRLREIHEIVRGLIAEYGYQDSLPALVEGIQNLAEISIADPLNETKDRVFRMWTQAVQDAIQEHTRRSNFEELVSEEDYHLASTMGIRLD